MAGFGVTIRGMHIVSPLGGDYGGHMRIEIEGD